MRTIAFAAMLGLTACANVGYVFDTYGAENRTLFAYSGKTWMIYDRPDINRMMVNAPIGDAIVAGATFGGVENQHATFSQVGRAFLASSGRTCSISDGIEIMTGQVEFQYAC